MMLAFQRCRKNTCTPGHFLRNGLPSLLILDIINYLWTELQAPVVLLGTHHFLDHNQWAQSLEVFRLLRHVSQVELSECRRMTPDRCSEDFTKRNFIKECPRRRQSPNFMSFNLYIYFLFIYFLFFFLL